MRSNLQIQDIHFSVTGNKHLTENYTKASNTTSMRIDLFIYLFIYLFIHLFIVHLLSLSIFYPSSLKTNELLLFCQQKLSPLTLCSPTVGHYYHSHKQLPKHTLTALHVFPHLGKMGFLTTLHRNGHYQINCKIKLLLRQI